MEIIEGEKETEAGCNWAERRGGLVGGVDWERHARETKQVGCGH